MLNNPFELTPEELIASISSGHYAIVHQKSLVAPRGRPDMQCEDVAVTFSSGETFMASAILKGCWNRNDVICDWQPSKLPLDKIHSTFDTLKIVPIMDLRGYALMTHPNIKLVLK